MFKGFLCKIGITKHKLQFHADWAVTHDLDGKTKRSLYCKDCDTKVLAEDITTQYPKQRESDYRVLIK